MVHYLYITCTFEQLTISRYVVSAPTVVYYLYIACTFEQLTISRYVVSAPIGALVGQVLRWQMRHCDQLLHLNEVSQHPTGQGTASLG